MDQMRDTSDAFPLVPSAEEGTELLPLQSRQLASGQASPEDWTLKRDTVRRSEGKLAAMESMWILGRGSASMQCVPRVCSGSSC